MKILFYVLLVVSIVLCCVTVVACVIHCEPSQAVEYLAHFTESNNHNITAWNDWVEYAPLSGPIIMIVGGLITGSAAAWGFITMVHARALMTQQLYNISEHTESTLVELCNLRLMVCFTLGIIGLLTILLSLAI